MNPWASFEPRGAVQFLTQALPEWDRSTVFTPQPVRRIPWRDLCAAGAPLQALWVGHVTFLLHMRGWRVMTDPLFSRRASPTQWAGPARFTPPACRVRDLPPLDVVCISHSHYDHLDETSVRELLAKAEADARADKRYAGLTWVCPLGVDTLLVAFGVERARIRCLDWWEDTVVVGGGGDRAPLRVTAVPAQHQSARTAWDHNQTLWAGFVATVEAPAAAPAATAFTAAPSQASAAVPPAASASSPSAPPLTVFFSGDTGFRTVAHGVAPHSAAEAAAPRCPAFAEIAARCPPIDLALLPIGAYSPRAFMSALHATPEDSVEMFRDLRARAAIGMHWGSVPLTDEPVREPVERLAAAVARAGLDARAFVASEPGEVWTPDGVLPEPAEEGGGGAAAAAEEEGRGCWGARRRGHGGAPVAREPA